MSHGAVSEGERGEGKEVTGQVRQGPVAITTGFYPEILGELGCSTCLGQASRESMFLVLPSSPPKQIRASFSWDQAELAVGTLPCPSSVDSGAWRKAPTHTHRCLLERMGP